MPLSEPGFPRRSPNAVPDLATPHEEAGRPLTRREMRERAAADAPARETAEPQPHAEVPRAEKSTTQAPRTPRVTHAASTTRSLGRRIAASAFTVGVMGCVGLLAVSMAAPAEAIAAAASDAPMSSIQVTHDEADEEFGEIQAYAAPANVTMPEVAGTEPITVESFAAIAASTGITNHTNFFINDASAAIQWPFAAGVPISSGFGPRWGSIHHGLDFTPGEGAEIQAVAAGTVRIADEAGGDFGVHVMIDHVINGEVFSTHYAHMIYGSLQVAQGQQVEAGTVLGLTGNTGLSYGAHLHFEVYVNEVRVDPLIWLREHAGG